MGSEMCIRDRINSDLLTGFRQQVSPPRPGYESEPTPCIWTSESGDTVVFGTSQQRTDAEYIQDIHGQEYLSSSSGPRAKVVQSPRLDKIGAVATLPENGIVARVLLPGLRVETVQLVDYETSLEASIRIAEYIVAKNLLPPPAVK